MRNLSGNSNTHGSKFTSVSKILIAIDGSSHSDHTIEYGIYMAKKLGAEMAVVHVNELPMTAPFTMDPLSNEPTTLIMDVAKAQEEANKTLFEYIQKKWGEEVSLRTYAKIGKPKEEILTTAEEYQADLIVMGTHGRVGLDHFLSGSVAEGVIRRSNCPVLVIPIEKKEE